MSYTTAFKDWYREFTEWRQTRPFAGAVLLILGGMIVGYVPMQLLVDVALLSGSFSFIGLVFAILMSLSGVFVLLRPEHSTFFGVAGVVLSTASILGALGGLFVGMTMGTVGGVLCFAWRDPATAADTAGDGESDGIGAVSSRNFSTVVLLCVAVLLLVYFAYPLLPALSLPGAEGQQPVRNVCDPADNTNVGLACQNPPVNQGIGGVVLSIGSFSTSELNSNAIGTIESSEYNNVEGTALEINNPDYTNGFVARKHFSGPNGPYHLELTSDSGSIEGSDQFIDLEITELYGGNIAGSISFITLDQQNKLICEPRNYAFLSFGDSLNTEVDIDDLVVNAHYAQASVWTLNNFELALEPGIQVEQRFVRTDNGDEFLLASGEGDTCPPDDL